MVGTRDGIGYILEQIVGNSYSEVIDLQSEALVSVLNGMCLGDIQHGSTSGSKLREQASATRFARGRHVSIANGLRFHGLYAVFILYIIQTLHVSVLLRNTRGIISIPKPWYHLRQDNAQCI